MQLSSPCSFYARKGTTDNSYFLVLALSQEESTGYSPSDETPPHPISTRPPKATTGTSHSLLYKHLCRELYTSYVTCMPRRRTFSLMNFIFFPPTAQIIGHCTKSVRESLPPPSLPLHTVAAAGNGCREDVNESPS